MAVSCPSSPPIARAIASISLQRTTTDDAPNTSSRKEASLAKASALAANRAALPQVECAGPAASKSALGLARNAATPLV